MEMFWTPGSLIQAEDRSHRIGQTQNVSIVYFLADNTIDEILWPLVRKKFKTLGEIVEGEDDMDMMTELAKPTSTSSSSKSGKSNEEERSSAATATATDGVETEMTPEVEEDLQEIAIELAKTDADVVKTKDDDDEDGKFHYSHV